MLDQHTQHSESALLTMPTSKGQTGCDAKNGAIMGKRTETNSQAGMRTLKFKVRWVEFFPLKQCAFNATDCVTPCERFAAFTPQAAADTSCLRQV